MFEECEVIKETTTDICRVSKEGNYLTIRFTEEYIVDVEDIHAIRSAMLEVISGEPSMVMVFPGRYGSITKEAREMDLFSIPDSQIIKSVAIVTGQLHQRLLGSLFFKLKPKNYPHKMFRNKEEAEKWLLELGF